jgi:hypothetical protein
MQNKNKSKTPFSRNDNIFFIKIPPFFHSLFIFKMKRRAFTGGCIHHWPSNIIYFIRPEKINTFHLNVIILKHPYQ